MFSPAASGIGLIESKLKVSEGAEMEANKLCGLLTYPQNVKPWWLSQNMELQILNDSNGRGEVLEVANKNCRIQITVFIDHFLYNSGWMDVGPACPEMA
jgi:hypothetical protein